MEKLVIGSRGSELALWQANHIKERLKKNALWKARFKSLRLRAIKS